jgi:hypothetical protein
MTHGEIRGLFLLEVEMYKRSEEYQKIGMEVMSKVEELKHLLTDDVRIDFMSCQKPKTSNGKAVYGECIKVQELYKPYCPYDFMIVIYDRNIEGMPIDQIKILMEHELLHIGYEVSDSGETRYWVRPHDYDDFKQITDKYGTEWANF